VLLKRRAKIWALCQGPEGAPVVPWDPAMLKPVFEELIPVCEELTIHQVSVTQLPHKLHFDRAGHGVGVLSLG